LGAIVESSGFALSWLVALVAGVVVAPIGGCSSSSGSPAPLLSAEGESCARTADCASGLVCVADSCVPRGTTGPAAAVDAAVVVVSEAGAPAAAGTPQGGVPEAAPPARTGALGESCAISSDCGTGLVCVPSASGVGGVCDLSSYGLTPTGKTCSGECAKGADCCELPLSTTIGTVAVKTCQDVLALVLAGNTTQCASAVPDSNVGVGCFVYATYCSTCATGNIWSCNAGQCVYSGTCQNSGVELGGCPSETRTGRPLSPFCDTTAGKCQLSPRGICNTSTDCDQKGTTDGAGTCRGGDCTCYQGGCYFSCASTLDCGQGTSCNIAMKLCLQGGTCSSDAQCASQLGVVNAKCAGGSCKVSCTSDRECSSSGLLPNPGSDAGSFGGKVCGGDGFCQDLGCATDADCQELDHNMNPGGSTLNYFCVTPSASAPAPVPASAITN
jgi:hypothetical protein